MISLESYRVAVRKISNFCITLNEFPYIRYYVPTNQQPLGALKPHVETRPPPPSESSTRWRTNLARGAEARAYESVEGDHATRLLAAMVQHNLEEYKKANADFAVCVPKYSFVMG
jgi:syntaxin-binding protein 1